jgi:hypothetical protein
LMGSVPPTLKRGANKRSAYGAKGYKTPRAAFSSKL